MLSSHPEVVWKRASVWCDQPSSESFYISEDSLGCYGCLSLFAQDSTGGHFDVQIFNQVNKSAHLMDCFCFSWKGLGCSCLFQSLQTIILSLYFIFDCLWYIYIYLNLKLYFPWTGWCFIYLSHSAARSRLKMESMLNKLKSTVTKVTADVTSAVMGNPVTREFEVGRHIASGGPGMCWRIYNGTKKSTKQVNVNILP